MKAKKITALCLSLLLMCSCLFSFAAYQDVSGSYQWASEAIDSVVAKNIMTPNSNTEFGVNNIVTKREFQQIVKRAYGSCDLPQTDEPLTREEMVHFLVAGMGLSTEFGPRDTEVLYQKFRDGGAILPAYRGSVLAAVQQNIISGYLDDTFRPKNSVTKAELAVLLTRVGTPGGSTEPDNPDEPDQPPVIIPYDRGERKMDMVMWMDIDIGERINDRPDQGWMPLNPEYPEDPTSGHYRVTTPLLGLYDSDDADTAKQHMYWNMALGCNVMACDFTNVRSLKETDKIEQWPWMEKFWGGVLRAYQIMLETASTITEFEAPKLYPVPRLNDTEYNNLQLMMDDFYELYEKYPDAWYKLDDGTDRADKPFVVIFANWDLLREWSATKKIPFDDERFNIRWSNGGLETQVNLEKDENGTNYIPADVPFWLFVEDDSPAKDGYFNPLYKMGPNNKPEQMITWASLHQGYGVWDGLHNQIDGKVPIQRYSEPVADVMPEVLLVNRWNYPLAWPEQPQEGVSREGSTHIEPNVDWGFDVFNSVTKEMYKLNAWKTDAPPKPVITAASAERVFIDLNGFPLEARISTDKNFSDAKWDYINVAKGGALLPEGASEGTTYYVQTRNTFGESEIATYKYRITQQ